MAGKQSKHVRLFLVVGAIGSDEADYLRAGGMSLGAVYLAGYAVECVLKALVSSAFAEHEQPAVMDRFRGRVGHDYAWLRGVYLANGGAGVPKPVLSAFVIVDTWDTNLRYRPARQYPGDVAEFFRAVGGIIDWVKGRVV